MATQTSKQPGNDIVIVSAVGLIGTALLALIAGINDNLGKVVVVVMVGFLIAWFLVNNNTVAGWVKNP